MICNMTGTIRRDDARPVAVHGGAAVCRHADDSVVAHECRSVARGELRASFPSRLLATDATGRGGGSLLVFILGVGYYITPALVGGRTGQLISNMIVCHIHR